MKVLITGATGLIGSKIVERCIRQNITVHYLTTSKEKIKNKDLYKGFYWNPKINEIDTAAFEGVQIIIHLAGATVDKRWTKSYKKVILDSRIASANLLFETLDSIEHGVFHFISASGISIYPNSETELYTEEYTEVADNFLAEVVVTWEAVAEKFRKVGMDVAHVRTGMVLAKDDGAFPKLVQPINLGVGAPLGSGNQWQSWIHVDDVVGIYMFILENELEGVYNAVAPTPVTNTRLTKDIANYLEVPLWMPNIPKFALRLLLGERAILATEGQLVSSKKIEKTGFVFRFSNLDLALKNLLKK